ncbi:bifunctional [glutamine synthetase] adenylyltransferase/[glutamine synthetase]-adenylyl-L-tyrosine phosphorylase [Bradyrhizobium sp. U87765 SZCCT0131]|uniref:bifunctional [glutamine synthetase] adenylyltransferase/[glutamine synthetase]-adenylyl-L-tyrosine phosphorylase n=1 Tax=unclassified Bradyrhizobium TaxID=2631580 RepID=UPI001BA7E785|nr:MULTISPECIES: bifunctional [glutamine synthetase] adenylyltransferase/[glutamine synthetase]-adenylyl-L-tyrosine phosphorylase [unclassified Bradyrhizobium]MBR1222605.1 bifunctional [glutamine synthetase] adenylyltransferase/[glutamine synthetase]-adenylyl-L-tyrosine phosphorylase [Bradyrhizobium sp. U87765 SZCCT0131]MBR1265314.1 bifunctional [glutamine synthetase] adenylyltransferase/[glutamine synthetase]-adenylyl-L-tyrosine phosphorylase [Bradyrhizobium sp. U87765 SZCCT0134]MBR1302907.1 bi
MISAAKADAEMISLAARFISVPCLSDAEAARQRLDEWLSEVAPETAAEIGRVFASHPRARTIFESIAEASPYLFDLARIDAARVLRLLECEPAAHLADLITRTAAAAPAAEDEAGVMRLLRRTKAEAALLIALCDIGEVWPVMTVTQALTDIAVTSVQSALRFVLTQEAARGRLQPPLADHAEEGSGLVVLSMGKMGAGELNYSSDIDLIVFFDLEAPTLAPDIEPQPFFVRATQAMARILQQRTADGYVFRVDLRLRPDPASTPVAISTAAALHYYEREGRTWERAAMIKARPCAGDLVAGEALVAEIAPFVWRKHLDFAALADVHDMKRQMQAFKGHADIAVEGHNVKIGRGGIREIEFFAQTQQLIAGGRHPELRVRPTLEALGILAATGWITTDARDELTTAYEFLRRVEHRLQMIADEQTHTLPEEPEAIARFARFFGYESRDHFSRDLLAQLNIVQGHYSKLFEGDPAASVTAPAVNYGAGPEDARLLERLLSLGFKSPRMVAGTLEQWFKGDYRALRVEATRQAFEAFVPSLVAGLAKAEDADAAVTVFDRFLQALQRGGRLITLLSQNSDLVELVALILGAAPRLGDMLARQPQIMDGLIDPRFFGAMPDQREISERLAATLADAGPYEEFLDRLRLFGQESLFLIGARILSGTVSAQHASVAFADVAEGIVRTVHRLVEDQFASQYGRIKGQETAILAMGKLGSREMTASSDLDLILVYDFDEDSPDSDGERSLHGPQYFARLTQRLISAFTTRTNYGVLYDIDMRLRPSGRAGPVASRVDAFADYQEHEAWTWEHMALTRARVISSSPALKARVETVIRAVLTRPRDHAITANDVLEMRRAIGEEKGEDDIWDLKYASGGLVDIEFIAQYLQLIHAATQPDILSVSTVQVLDQAARLGILPPATADVLRSAARLYHDLTQILRLCVSAKFQPATAGEDLLRILARAGDVPNFSVLEARVRETQVDVRQILLELLDAKA